MNKKYVLIIVLVALFGCNSSKSVVGNTKSNSSSSSDNKKPTTVVIKATKKGSISSLVNDYIMQYKNSAMRNMKTFGIPASIILAQGILESGAGQGRLATTANNHFGIKCYTDWKGETTLHDDDLNQECFRKYKNPEESYSDHAVILTKRKRYAPLFLLAKGDYKGWAKGLKLAGYATDPQYPEKLINYIELYELDQYDAIVLGGKANSMADEAGDKKVVHKNNRYSTRHIVIKGDTLYSISKKYNISIENIKKQNDIFDDTISVGQNLKIQ